MTELVSLAALAFQSAVLALCLVAIQRENVPAAVNGVAALVLTLVPAVLDIALEIRLGPELPLWIAVAGTLHSLGMLGLYDSTWWWDHLTHTVSAGLVAALIYASVVVTPPNLFGITNASDVAAIVTVGLTLAVGVFWEVLELVARAIGYRYDIPPVLVHYGWRDTLADLVFDTVGALVVVGLELRVFVSIAETHPDATGTLLVWTAWGVVLGSVAASLVLIVGRISGVGGR
jgi:hypothetical protein